MSVKTVTRGIREGRDANSEQKNIHHDPTVQKPIVFHDNSKPSPLLSDESEFPSLNKSSGIVSSNSFSTGKILKYSDKLKSHSFSRNHSSVSECFTSKSNVVTNVYDQHRNKNLSTNDQNSWRQVKNNVKMPIQSINQNNPVKSQFRNSKKMDVGSSQNFPKRQQKELFKEENSLPQQLLCDKDGQTKEKHLANTSKSPRCVNSSRASESTTYVKSTSHFERVSAVGNKVENRDTEDVQNISKVKKKKRKSKVKRQVAMQSGKITVLTPEVHLKILNQTSALNVHCSRTVLTDINDEEEYPELGKTLLPTNQKDSHLKKEISLKPFKENIEMPSSVLSEEKVVIKESPGCDFICETPANEKKEKSDTKTTVHSKDPIALSFYEMLLNKNPKPKVREVKEGLNTSSPVELTKMKMKKNTCQPHNLLDSSSPMVKRGKEREKPKAKKPSMLKKIILLDRKARKEHFLLLKSNNPANDNELDEDVTTNDNENEVVIEKAIPSESYESSCQLDLDLEEADFLFSEEDDDDNLPDKFVPMIERISNSGTYDEQSSVGSSPLDILCDNVIPKKNLDDYKLNLSVDEVFNYEKDSNIEYKAVTIAVPVSSLEVSYTDSLDVSSLSGLKDNVNKSESYDKEKAAKILLHTRNFREYCNHLISKDIDDAVFALIDDLARFQDRLHQKDPVKARMKKRMIYGVKEVKKHIKLKKLKCIIIAVDIENVESQGGLNDVLNDIKLLAADHHIPCVFALSRKVLGKVCHKPVPISCVGVFNFEGSEANFKRMVELQTQSKTDYNELFDKLFLKLTEKETLSLLKAKTEAPETLHSIRVNILNDFFMQSKIDAAEK